MKGSELQGIQEEVERYLDHYQDCYEHLSEQQCEILFQGLVSNIEKTTERIV